MPDTTELVVKLDPDQLQAAVKAGIAAHVEPVRERIERLESALREALPIVSYVSAGRRFVDVEPYPDATARRVNAQIRDILEGDQSKIVEYPVSTSENLAPEPTEGQGVDLAAFDVGRYDDDRTFGQVTEWRDGHPSAPKPTGDDHK